MATGEQGPAGPRAGTGPGRSKNPLLIVLGLAVVIVLGWLLWPTPTAGTVTVYKSPACTCCGFYTVYLEKNGFKVRNVNVDDIEVVKEKYGIPEDLHSCHTALVGEYVIEGHVPIEAVNKLLTEKPNIKGIALPGMPLGSPGMGGEKAEPFVIYVIGDGPPEVYMTL